jgi:O-antigen/teichoic acid export membrane protein
MYFESVVKYKVKISMSSIDKSLTNEFVKFCLIIFLSGIGASFLALADQQLISKYLGLGANGIYTTAIFMVTVIELPKRFVGEISAPLIAKAFAAGEFDNINEHYKKASINLFLTGGILLLLLVINLDNIYMIMPNGSAYETGKQIVIIIGLAKLINLLFSLNDSIIAMSKFYKYNMLLIVVLGIGMISADIFLIPRFGMVGAAYALFTVLFFHGFLKMVLLKIKFNFFPFTVKTVMTIVLLILLFGMSNLIPFIIHPIIDIAIRSFVIICMFAYAVYNLKLSYEINSLINLAILRLKSYIK